jgi:hypothetical protein
MNNKYLKMMGAGLFVVALVAWRQSIITMDNRDDNVVFTSLREMQSLIKKFTDDQVVGLEDLIVTQDRFIELWNYVENHGNDQQKKEAHDMKMKFGDAADNMAQNNYRPQNQKGMAVRYTAEGVRIRKERIAVYRDKHKMFLIISFLGQW